MKQEDAWMIEFSGGNHSGEWLAWFSALIRACSSDAAVRAASFAQNFETSKAPDSPEAVSESAQAPMGRFRSWCGDLRNVFARRYDLSGVGVVAGRYSLRANHF